MFVWTVDPSRLYLVSFIGVIYLLAAIYATGYISKKRLPVFSFLMLVSYASGTLVFLSGALLTLFVFLELMMLSSFFLIAFEKSPASYRAAKLYVYLGLGAGALILLVSAVVHNQVGSTGFDHIAAWPDVVIHRDLLAVFLIGAFGVKMGLFPGHVWLPKAHPIAPAPASAILSGIVVKTALFGLFLSLRSLYPGGDVAPIPQLLLTVIGMVTLIYGGLMSVISENPKVILAYSTISHMGGLSLGILVIILNPQEPQFAQAVIMYATFHALNKALLFLGVGAAAQGRAMARTGVAYAYGAAVFVGGIALFGLPKSPVYAGKNVLHALDISWVHLLLSLATIISAAYTIRLFYESRKLLCLQASAGNISKTPVVVLLTATIATLGWLVTVGLPGIGDVALYFLFAVAGSALFYASILVKPLLPSVLNIRWGLRKKFLLVCSRNTGNYGELKRRCNVLGIDTLNIDFDALAVAMALVFAIIFLGIRWSG